MINSSQASCASDNLSHMVVVDWPAGSNMSKFLEDSAEVGTLSQLNCVNDIASKYAN